jgi:hypothetical protein
LPVRRPLKASEWETLYAVKVLQIPLTICQVHGGARILVQTFRRKQRGGLWREVVQVDDFLFKGKVGQGPKLP